MKYSSKWKPVNEAGEITDKDFDKRFKIDRTWNYNSLLFRNRIRIVKYPNDKLFTVFITSIPYIPIEVYRWVGKNIRFGYFLNSFIYNKTYNLTSNEIEKKLKYTI